MIEKYDRQLRVFTSQTQKIIFNSEIKIISSKYNFIIYEIFKNFLLLGIKRIFLDRKFRNELKDFESLNDDCEIIYFDSIDNKDNDCVFVEISPQNKTFRICPVTLSFSLENLNEKSESLSKKENKFENHEFQCLLGAIFCQEIVKMFGNEKYAEEFSLESIF